MRDLVMASEAIAAGVLSRNDLRRRYTKVYRNVYVRRGAELTAYDRAVAAWLWSGREAVLVGASAAAVLGAKWSAADDPPELARIRHPSPTGIVVRSGVIANDEIRTVDAMRCTAPARTAYDLGRRLPFERAVIRMDALLNATRTPLSAVEVIGERYPGARGIIGFRKAIDVVDAGAESPQETRLRLLLVSAIAPRPVTQIPVADGRGRVVRRIDMGWPDYKVGVEYDGEQHFKDPEHYANDIVRLEFLADCGWRIVRVSARQLRYERAAILTRVTKALAAANMPFTRLRDYGC